MTEREGFLTAIIENPDDDAPRLQYADWLEEKGECERAEFIRVQIELARSKKQCCERLGELLPDVPVRIDSATTAFRCEQCRWCLLKERELLQSHKTDWLPPEVAEAAIFGSATSEQVAAGLKWHRGFVSEITLTCQDWFTHRESLLRACPLEKVTLTDFHSWNRRDLWRDDFPAFPRKFIDKLPPFGWVTNRGDDSLMFHRDTISDAELDQFIGGNTNVPRPQGTVDLL